MPHLPAPHPPSSASYLNDFDGTLGCDEVADDGLGRPGPRRQSGGLGLLGMRERAATLDGTLEAGPRAGSGWVVRVAVPLPVPARAGQA